MQCRDNDVQVSSVAELMSGEFEMFWILEMISSPFLPIAGHGVELLSFEALF